MRIVILAAVLGFLLAAPLSADWIKLDDFEGDLSNWNTTYLVGGIVSDPDDAGNNVLFVDDPAGSGSSDNTSMYLSLGANTIAIGDTGTLFGRMRTGGALADTNGHFGFSTSTAPAAWGDFTAYMSEDGQWSVHDGGYNTTDQQPAAEAWINFWIVVDNPNDVYHVYYTTTYGEDAEAGDQMSHSTNDKTFACRGGTGANAMETLLIRAGTSNPSGWYLDDLYIDSSSQNLSNPVSAIPEPGTMLLLGTGILGALGYIRRRRMK